jgi:hypothetical protein
LVTQLDPTGAADADSLAAAILSEALRLDQGRPRDDATVLVLKLTPHPDDDNIRHLSLRFPI